MPRPYAYKRAAGDHVTCAAPDCEAAIPNHCWGRIKNDAWFHQKDGTSWCPSHHPDWVAAWRARKVS